jgi:hypothetical protein
VERAIPPDAREAVLGDLWERYHSPVHFAAQAFAMLPFLVAARVLRRSSWPVLALQIFILFAALHGFAPTHADAAAPMWARAMLPTFFAFLALAWHDAYRARRTDGPPRATWGEGVAVVFGIGLSQMLTVTLVSMSHVPVAWLLTRAELLFAVVALPGLYVLRSRSWLQPAGPRAVRSDIVDEYECFRARVRRRNRLEVSAMLAILFLSAVLIYRAGGSPSAIVWLTQATFAILCAYLAVNGGAPALPFGASAAEVRQRFRFQMFRQNRLRSRLMWWWFTPMFIGLAGRAVVFIMALLRSNHPAVAAGAEPLPGRTIFGIVLAFALAACVHALNQERTSAMRRRIDDLGLQRLEG